MAIYLLVSRGDRALDICSRLHGARDRLGSIRSRAGLGGPYVEVIDVSGVKSDDLLGHFKEATSPAMIDFIHALNAKGWPDVDRTECLARRPRRRPDPAGRQYPGRAAERPVRRSGGKHCR